MAPAKSMFRDTILEQAHFDTGSIEAELAGRFQPAPKTDRAALTGSPAGIYSL